MVDATSLRRPQPDPATYKALVTELCANEEPCGEHALVATHLLTIVVPLIRKQISEEVKVAAGDHKCFKPWCPDCRERVVKERIAENIIRR